jgi:hypothetical protein
LEFAGCRKTATIVSQSGSVLRWLLGQANSNGLLRVFLCPAPASTLSGCLCVSRLRMEIIEDQISPVGFFDDSAAHLRQRSI